MIDRFDEWEALVAGQSIDPDRFAGNQCVDVVDHLGEFLYGIPWPQCVGGVRGAKDLLDVAPDKYWQRIDYYHGFIPQRMDVLVFGGDKYNEWGHTAPTLGATATYIDVLQQDGFGAPLKFVDGGWYSNKPVHRARLAYSANGTGPLKGVLRPRPELFVRGGTIQLIPQSTITPITPIQEDEVSAEEVFSKKLTLKNGAESTFETQVVNISDDLSKVLKRQEEDRNYAQAVNGKLDGIINLIAALPTEVLRQKITTVDGRETTLETEVKWLPTNFQAVQSGGQA